MTNSRVGPSGSTDWSVEPETTALACRPVTNVSPMLAWPEAAVAADSPALSGPGQVTDPWPLAWMTTSVVWTRQVPVNGPAVTTSVRLRGICEASGREPPTRWAGCQALDPQRRKTNDEQYGHKDHLTPALALAGLTNKNFGARERLRRREGRRGASKSIVLC